MKKIILKLLNPYKSFFDYDQKYEWDKIALDSMGSCKKILDTGCGEGRFISHNPKTIIGVDHNKKSLKVCKKRGYSVKYSKATSLPFKDASFDAVHCSHVIEHLIPEDAHKLLSEMNRVLKAGGVFCLRTPLLHKGFYFDLTHIKPYYPKAILHYINIEKTNQKTLDDVGAFYKVTKLKYRKEQFLAYLPSIQFRYIDIIFNMLYRFGITGFKNNGYMLILKKVK